MNGVVKFDDAVRCCENGATRIELEIYQLIGDLLRAFTDEQEELANKEGLLPTYETTRIALLARTPPPGPIVTPAEFKEFAIRRVPDLRAPPGGAAVVHVIVGSVLLLGSFAISQYAQSVNNTVSVLTQFQEALQKRVTKQTKKTSCEKCLEEKLLSQSRPRERVTAKVYRRK